MPARLVYNLLIWSAGTFYIQAFGGKLTARHWNNFLRHEPI
jgi:hypothetical protein